MSRDIRVKIGVLLILFAALFSNLRLFKDMATGYYESDKINIVSKYEKWFGGIRKYLPARGIVGYISGTDVKDIRLSLPESTRYFITQYVVSPLMVEHTAENDLVIGDFEPGEDASVAIRKNRLTVIRDFGNGVMLLKGAKK